MSGLNRLFATLLVLALSAALITGCGPAKSAEPALAPAANVTATVPPTPSATAVATKTPVPTATSASATVESDAQEFNELLQRPVPKTPKPSWPAPGEAAVKPAAKPTAAFVLPTVTPTPQVLVAQSTRGRAVGLVTADRVNVRGGPGTAYAILSSLQKSSDFAIIGRNDSGSWLQICCVSGAQDEQNWIAAEFVDVALPEGMALADLPVPEIPPTPVAAVASAATAGNTQSAAGLAAASALGLPGAGNFAAAGGANPLTGGPIAGDAAGGRPVIVCINNDYAARPQFGLSQADVVYEYLMEGWGITRFSAIYYGQPSSQIGPVRSARLINYYMGALYDAGLACSGASDQVRYALKHQAPFPYMDIDLDDASNTRYSVSVGSDYRTRLRTATGKLRRWLADWGVDKPAAIRGFTFGNAPSGGAPAASIAIPYPRATGSQVAYRYDAGSGRYLRSLGGAAHVDGNTGAQLALDNVIVQFVAHQATNIVEDSLGSTSIRLDLFGSGRALVFRDGQAFEGTWRSENRGDTPRFYDATGAEIPLKPGQSWISIVPPDYDIAYQ